MKKELINIGQSLDLTTGELSTLNEHKNVFSGHLLIRGAVSTGKNKFIKHLFNQFINKDNIDIYFIDFKGSREQKYMIDLIKAGENNSFNINYFSNIQNNIQELNKYKNNLNDLNLFDKNKNLYLFQTFPLLDKNLAKDFYINILNHLINKATHTTELKDVIVFIPYFDVLLTENLITLFNKAGGLGFKIILSTDSNNLTYLNENVYIEDYINNYVFFKYRNISEKDENILLKNKNTNFLDFMKLQNLKNRHFLFSSNNNLYYCLAPFIK